MPKDRGAEQRDVDGPLECSLALVMVAVEKGGSITARRAAGTLPTIHQKKADHATTVQESANFLFGDVEKLTGADDPQHALQKNGGLADLWYMDDGDIMCHPILVERNPENRSHLLRERPGCSLLSG